MTDTPTPPQTAPDGAGSVPQPRDGAGQPQDGAETPRGPVQGFARVQGRCPACRGASLFLGAGGHVTCSRIDCPGPTAADELLHHADPIECDHEAALGQAQAAIARVRAVAHIADEDDVTDWQRGFRACSVVVLGALDEPGPAATQATETTQCGHGITGAFGRPLGPCIRPPGHAALFHRDGNGTEWRPTSRTTPKEATMPTCTATIEGPHVMGDGPIQCAREAGHRDTHIGPTLDGDPRTLWGDHHAGATPHQPSSEEPTTHTSSAPAAHHDGPTVRECTDADRNWDVEKGGER